MKSKYRCKIKFKKMKVLILFIAVLLFNSISISTVAADESKNESPFKVEAFILSKKEKTGEVVTKCEPSLKNETHAKEVVKKCKDGVDDKISKCAVQYGRASSNASIQIIFAEYKLKTDQAMAGAENGVVGGVKKQISNVTTANDFSNAAESARSILSASMGSCDPGLLSELNECKMDQKLTEEDVSVEEIGKQCLTDLYAIGMNALVEVSNKISGQQAIISTSEKSATKARDSLLTYGLIGAGAVGAIAMVKSKNDDKKEDKAKSQTEKDYKKGIIVNGNGDKVSCLSEDTYGSSECRQVLLDYCSDAANSGKAGCGAFNNIYCSEGDASQSYCLANTAKVYCKSSGTNNTDSPSCKWITSRPTTCLKNPEALECMSSYSKAQLDEKCGSYPNDPLCQAHNAGKVVTQPGDGSEEDSTQAQNSGSLNSILNGSNTSASVADVNLFGRNTQLVQELCDRGSIVNCK